MTNRILFCPVGPPQIIAEPAKFEAAQSTRYTDGSVIVEPRKPIFPPHMIQALLVRLRDRCSVVGTPASPAARRHGSSSPRLAEMLASANISAAPLHHRALEQATGPPLLCVCHLDFSIACLISVR